ncbi:hypothetical protein ABZP36_008695 [Zizania latifolia]
MDSSMLGSMLLLLALMLVVVAAKDDAAFPESRTARSLLPLLELYIKALANKIEEAKPLAALLYKKEEVRKTHMCLGDCLATNIDNVSKALAAFSTTVDINDKFIKMDHFLQRFT